MSDRKDIEWIAQSSWFKDKCLELGEKTEDVFREGAVGIKEMQLTSLFGFPMEAIKETIENKRLNHVNACFNLLRLNA